MSTTATLEQPTTKTGPGPDKGPIRTFRLLQSLHWDDGGVMHDARDPETKFVKSHRDLVAEFGREKFVEVSANDATAPPVVKYVPMEAMTLGDLQSFARDEGIDLKSAKTKPEVLKILQVALSS